jgi:hypothetical protein
MKMPKFFIIFAFDSNKFLMNIFFFNFFFHLRVRKYETNLLVHPCLSRSFQQYQEHGKRHHGSGNLNVTNINEWCVDMKHFFGCIHVL